MLCELSRRSPVRLLVLSSQLSSVAVAGLTPLSASVERASDRPTDVFLALHTHRPRPPVLCRPPGLSRARRGAECARSHAPCGLPAACRSAMCWWACASWQPRAAIWTEWASRSPTPRWLRCVAVCRRVAAALAFAGVLWTLGRRRVLGNVRVLSRSPCATAGGGGEQGCARPRALSFLQRLHALSGASAGASPAP